MEPQENPTITTAKTASKRARKTVTIGQVHINSSMNNTMIVITDRQGNALTSSSAGASGFRGSKKGTAYAAQIASEKAITDAKQKFGMSVVDVIVKGTGLGRDTAIRALMNAAVSVESITDVTTIAHGGCRPKRMKKG